MNRFLFDKDVIIDYLRGNKQAIEYFETIDGEFHLSAITTAELYTGVKGEEERNQLEYFLSLFDIIPVSKEIETEGGQLRQKWHKSHGTGLADALIAATAISKSLTLISLNKKHFGMMETLHFPYKK
jgi:predicted nucleic acid-binding protein